ncbi:hypothetical protein EIN_476160 [Entamoeba invadens IP1]|uniref:Uncharacterized protein n=1 Tax=Entamoeba invadens IP1 TaxID=370355 RepID=A0A0A1U3V0_ENTIV|nr:hypothetical protein EIN_476160 [Entamoeba invadens IP1]ELP88904.1 hypothetical protein EIN_476160 [Entamoeba invadens IP1]|eukprot:XP_004255675.1 hypothetical protein EIN_476160 [Entamoeba invadens IP1]
MLNQLGYNTKNLKDAIKKFQGDNGLSVDGRAGPSTVSKLQALTNSSPKRVPKKAPKRSPKKKALPKKRKLPAPKKPVQKRKKLVNKPVKPKNQKIRVPFKKQNNLKKNTAKSKREKLSQLKKKETPSKVSKSVQQMLEKLGFICGKNGEKAGSALKSFQSQNGLRVTGKVDTMTLKKLQEKVKGKKDAIKSKKDKLKDKREKKKTQRKDKLQKRKQKAQAQKEKRKKERKNKRKDQRKDKREARRKDLKDKKEKKDKKTQDKNNDKNKTTYTYSAQTKHVQQMLIKLGYNCGPKGADGKLGPDTTNAIKKFQGDNGLQVDGKAGPQTIKKLESKTGGSSSNNNSGTSNGKPSSEGFATKPSTSYSAQTKHAQEMLIKLGYNCGPKGADGKLGPDTTNAVKSFQQKNGLTVDGIIGPNTIKKLEAMTSSSGSSNTPQNPSQKPSAQSQQYSAQVKHAQEMLIKLGYNCGPDGADGYAGPNTVNAVKQFQQKYGLAVDGKVGPQTISKLESLTKNSSSANTQVAQPKYSAQVKHAQEMLIKLGYNCGPDGADGYAGVNTVNAVKQFQKKYNLMVDGEIGPQTISKLESLTGMTTQTSTGKGGSPHLTHMTTNRVADSPNHPVCKSQNRCYEEVFYLQCDSRWATHMYSGSKNKNKNVCNGGCGPTSMAMVIATLVDGSVTPNVISDFSMNNGWKDDDVGTYWSLFPAAAKKYGLHYETVHCNMDRMRTLVNAGGLAVTSMGPPVWTKYGHFISVNSFDGDYVWAHDPYYHGVQSQKVSEFKSQCKEGWVFWV